MPTFPIADYVINNAARYIYERARGNSAIELSTLSRYDAFLVNNVYSDGAVQFDAADLSQLKMTTAYNPGTSDFALSFHLNIKSLPSSGFGGIIASGAGSNGVDGFFLAIDASGVLKLFFNDSVQATRATADLATGLTTGSWYHIIVNFDRDVGATAFVGNVQKNTGDITGHQASLGQMGQPSTIGGYPGFFAYQIDASIDQMGIWNRLLDSDERTFLFNSNIGRRYDELTTSHKVGLQHWYNFDEITGIRYDSHGTNHLTQVFSDIINATTQNGGFETLGAGGADVFGTWSEYAAGTTAVTAGTPAWAGSYDLKIAVDASGSLGGVLRNNLLKLGKLYRTSFYGKCTGTGNVLVYHGTTQSQVLTQTLTTSWALYTAYGRPNTDGNLAIYSNQANGVSEVDNVILQAAEILGAAGVGAGLCKDSNFAAKFNGINQYLSCACNATLSTSTNDFSIIASIYVDRIATFAGIASKVNGGVAALMEYSLDFNTTAARFSVSDGTTLITANISSAITIGNWYFLYAYYDSSTRKAYVSVNNGTPTASATSIAASGIQSIAAPFEIGRAFVNNAYCTQGKIANVAVYKRKLTAAELTYIFNGGRIRSYSEIGLSGTDGSDLKTNLVSWFGLEEKSGNRSDSQGVNTLTDNNGVSQAEGVNYTEGVVSSIRDSVGSNHLSQSTLLARPGYSLVTNPKYFVFDGVSDSIASLSDFIGTAAASVSFWINPVSWGGSSAGRVLSNGKFEVNITSTNSCLKFYSDGITAATSANSSIALNTWKNVLITRTAAGVANIYINGILSGTANQDSGTPSDGTTVVIGNRTSLDRPFDGYINDVCFYNRVLTSAEALTIYNQKSALYV